MVSLRRPDKWCLTPLAFHNINHSLLFLCVFLTLFLIITQEFTEVNPLTIISESENSPLC